CTSGSSASRCSVSSTRSWRSRRDMQSSVPARGAPLAASSFRTDDGASDFRASNGRDASRRGSGLRSAQPRLDLLLEHIEGQSAVAEHVIMERPDVELRPELLLRSLPQLEDLQLSELVAECLGRPGDVAIRLALDVHLVDRGVGVEEVDDLLTLP